MRRAGCGIMAVMSTATWFTGRRRAVRASIYAASAICTIVCAVGLAFGHVALAWRAGGGAPTEPLLAHGGAVGLVGLAVVAALTIYGWRAELAGALAASGSSILALAAVVHVWLGVHVTRFDAAAGQAVVATLGLAIALLARLVVDVILDAAEHRVRAADGGLPVAARVTARGFSAARSAIAAPQAAGPGARPRCAGQRAGRPRRLRRMAS